MVRCFELKFYISHGVNLVKTPVFIKLHKWPPGLYLDNKKMGTHLSHDWAIGW